MLTKWCQAYDEVAPIASTISPLSYILEVDGVPALFISVITTNVSWAYLENYCGNPEFKGVRQEAVQHFIKHLQATAKEHGHDALVTFSYKPKLSKAFEAYGFTKVVDGLTAFCKAVA